MEEKTFVEETKMQTETVYQEDGSIHTYPSSHELGRVVTADNRVSQRGRCVTTQNGETHFKPYAESGEKKSQNLFCTKHGIVTKTKRCFKVSLKFSADMDNNAICSSIIDECRDITFNCFLKK